jgi:elongation factor 1-alpha
MLGNRPEKAMPEDSVGLIVEGVEDVERGEVISYPENPAKGAGTFKAEIILFTDTEIRTGEAHTVRVGTAEKKCKIDEILNEIDQLSLTIRQPSSLVLRGGEVGEAKFSPMEPLCLEKHSEFPPLGRFVIQGKKGPIGAGIVSNVEHSNSEKSPKRRRQT